MTISNQEWENLFEAGIPMAATRELIPNPASFENLSPLILRILMSENEPRLIDAIRGWLLALRDHYPTTFKQYFDRREFEKFLSGTLDGRTIKLRRLALSHLGKIL